MQAELQRFRQVHLDFHTSKDCEGVGADFDARAFVETLKMGHVNSINIFAKCHHGYSYYPTKVGTMHPNLSFDLLGAQIEALHAADIRCPIYVSVKWDDLAGMQHPDWIVARKDNTLAMRPPLSGAWGWTTMDVSTSYGDYFLAQVEELCDLFGDKIDGFWFDICFPVANYSAWSQQQIRQAGVDLEDDQAVWRYTRQKDLDFFARVSSLVRRRAAQATVYYNGTTTSEMAEVEPYLTHFEVESLPTSGDAWGYLHYPIVARHARTFGKEVIGMTGRFHISWADFGGLKTRDQLDYECSTILAAGGRICVGDQMHPRGMLDPAVYRLLAHSFGRVEKLEPWLEGARPAAEAAILALGQPVNVPPGTGAYSPDVEGAAQLLLETGIQFDIVDSSAEVSHYAVIFLPDGALLNQEQLDRLETYLQGGGKLVMSGTAALAPGGDLEEGRFQITKVPVNFLGPAPTRPSYLRPGEWLSGDSELAPEYDYVFYDQAYLVEPILGAEAHGSISQALFNRTWDHFTSHRHAPVGKPLNSPLVVCNDQVLYFAAPLFSAYRAWDYWAYRAMAQNALLKFMPSPLLVPGGPGWVEFTLHNQPSGPDHPRRRMVHIVAYHPRRSLQPIPHVDQSWPVSGLSVKVRQDGGVPTSVYLAPDRSPAPFSIQDGYIDIQLPPIRTHAVLVIE